MNKKENKKATYADNDLIFYIVVIAALLIVSGTFTYSRYTYHYKTTFTVTIPATECSTLGLTLSNCVIANGGNSIDIETAKANIADNGTPDFTTTAEEDEGMYATEDDYGTSYYYRGSVTNNYVSFAGYIWRIIRVNGDGSVRMILNSNYTTSAFNTKYGSNAYLGYMYGTAYTENETTTITQTLQNYYYYYSTSYLFDEITGFTLINPTQQVWNSSLNGYYTCMSSSTTTCTTLYKVVYSNTYQGYYYTYEAVGAAGSYVESDGDTLSSIQTFATRYYYGTGYEYDENNGYTLTGYDYNIYDGTGNVSDLTGYFTCGSTDYYACTTLYQIESASSISKANVTKYTLITNDYTTTHENKNDSTIKTVVDEFYEKYIKGQTDDESNLLEKYLSDTLFCNDRSYYYGTGTETTKTYYNGYRRLYSSKEPSLKCENKNDEFTVEEIELENGTKVGNGSLTYPIGLITGDELAMAGGKYGINNNSYYLYTGNNFWTMTTYYFNGTHASEFGVNSSGSLSYYYVDDTNRGVRPVINLSSEVLVASGTGTSSDLYELKLPD